MFSDTSFVDNGDSPENLEPVSSGGRSGVLAIACMGSTNLASICTVAMETGAFLNNSGASTALLMLASEWIYLYSFALLGDLPGV